MNVFVYKIKTNPRFIKVFQWVRLISISGIAQVSVQGVNLLCGIFIIRLLSPNEYALYTIANMMLSTMIVLAECDLSSAIMAQGSKYWSNPEKLGAVLATGFAVRKKLGIISVLIVTPILLYLLLHHDASWLASLLILAALIPAFFASLTDTILEVPPKLRQDIIPLQKNQLQASVARLVLTSVSVFLSPFTFVALLGAGIPRIWANFKLRKISSAYVSWNQKPDPLIEKDIMKFVKRVLPVAVYYSFSGQLTIWLISIFGSVSSIAQVGALGRLSSVLGIVNILFGMMVAPRFARLVNWRKLLFLKYVQVQTIMSILFLIIIGIVWLCSSEILWILGKSYSNLQSELVLSVIGSSLGLLAGCFYGLNSARGWIINPIVSIVISVATIIAGVLIFDLSSLQGILFFNILIGGSYFFTNALFGWFKIKRAPVNSDN